MASPAKEYVPWFVKAERGTELKKEKTSTVDGTEKRVKAISSSSSSSQGKKRNSGEISVKVEPLDVTTRSSGKRSRHRGREPENADGRTYGRKTLQHLGKNVPPCSSNNK